MLASTQDELLFSDYQQRQQHEASREGLANRAANVSPSGKFRLGGGGWQPQPYVGHALVTMVNATPANEPLSTPLATIRNELSCALCNPAALYFLPEESYHQTIANTLSAERHQRSVIERGLQATYPGLVTDVFADIPAVFTPTPLSMRVLGLGIFSSAIGLLCTFDTEEDFKRVIHFRDHFYGHEQIGRLGIRRTRPFIGHITVAYVETPLTNPERRALSASAGALNDWLDTQRLRFFLPTVELRSYEHLARFNALPDLPKYYF